MISRPGPLIRIARNDRLTILRFFANELASMQDLNIINVVVDKQDKAQFDVFTRAWQALLQRFENTMARGNFPGPANNVDYGMVFPDHTDDKKLTLLLRQMRRYNPVPNQVAFGSGYRNLTLTRLVEDPNFRDSSHSYFIQAADVAAYLLYQNLAPNSYMRKTGGSSYFNRLQPILCTVASNQNPLGIVKL